MHICLPRYIPRRPVLNASSYLARRPPRYAHLPITADVQMPRKHRPHALYVIFYHTAPNDDGQWLFSKKTGSP